MSLRVALADEGGQQRIMAESIVVIEVFVAEGQCVDALPKQMLDLVLDEVGVAVVVKTIRHAFSESQVAIDCS